MRAITARDTPDSAASLYCDHPLPLRRARTLAARGPGDDLFMRRWSRKRDHRVKGEAMQRRFVRETSGKTGYKSSADLPTVVPMGRRRDDASSKRRSRPWIGENLRRIRKARQISQRALEERSGVGRAVITRLELGVQDDATLDTLERLAEALQSTVEELIRPTIGESDADAIGALIDEFERQERGEIEGRAPMVYAQPDEIAWLRSLPSVVWIGAPPTVELLAGFVQGYRRRKQQR